MEILFIHSSICRLDLGISCLKLYILVVYIFLLMYDNPVHVPGSSIFKMEKNIVAPLSWLLLFYEVLRDPNLRFVTVVS